MSLSNYKTIICYLIFLLVLITIIICIEGLFYYINLYLLGYHLLTITFCLFIHVVIVHYLVSGSLFIGQVPLLKNIMLYMNGCNQGVLLINYLTNCISVLNGLLNGNEQMDNNECSNVSECFNEICSLFQIYEEMKEEYSLSKYQNEFYNEMKLFIDNYNKYIVNHISNNEITLTKGIVLILNNCKKLISLIQNYLQFKYSKQLSFNSLKSFLYNDILSSLNQRKIEFGKTFNCSFHYLVTSDSNVIDYAIIHNSKENNEKSNLLIYCNPNGSIYELYTPRLFKNYILYNVDILVWNYRGYGYSTGYSSFNNIKRDVVELYDEIIKMYPHKWNDIGVHGYSIGGVPAVHLAHVRNISLLISDRNFSDIDSISQSYKYVWIYYLYKLLMVNSSYIVESYLKCFNNKCYKIILCDPNDEVILNNGSLKSGISRYIIKKYIDVNHKESNILKILLTKEEYKLFIQSLIYISMNNDLNTLTPLFTEEDVSQLKDDSEIDIKNFFSLFSKASDYLDNLCNNNKKSDRIKEIEINTYFNNLIIWGSYSFDKKSFCRKLSIDNNDHLLSEALSCLQEIIQINSIHNYETNIHKHIYNVKNTLENLRIKLHNIKPIPIDKGELIRINCGHNGVFDQQRLITYLIQSGFISKKENINSNKY